MPQDPAIIDPDECIHCGSCAAHCPSEPSAPFDCEHICNVAVYYVQQDICKKYPSSCEYVCIDICPIACIYKRSEWEELKQCNEG